MQQEQAIQNALDLVNNAAIAMLGTNGDAGYPNMRVGHGKHRVPIFRNMSGTRFH